MLTEEELIRYSRQVIIPGIEEEGQEILMSQNVIIVGGGGLGCPVALFVLQQVLEILKFGTMT